jgi:alpha-1,6-mannosyltransferase
LNARPGLAGSPLVRLALLGAATAAIYLAGFALPYPVESGIGKPLLQFARLTGPAPVSTLLLIATVAALFALYLAAVRQCLALRESRVGISIVAIFGLLSAAVLVRMYPLFSLDVFYYMAADRIWSVWRENPFVVPPLQAAHDPFFAFTTWGHYPLPYGPSWPWISEITSKLGRNDVFPTLLAFKWLSALGYAVCLPLIAWAAAALHPERLLAALCIFAWNPLVLLELVGGGHNDAIALAPAILAVGLWARRATIAVPLAGIASLTVKATASVLAPALLWASFTRAARAGRVPGWIATHLAPGLLLFGLAWWPFASGGIPPGFLREADQDYQSLTAIALAVLPPAWREPGLRLTQLLLLAGFGLFYLSQLRSLANEGPAAIQAMWRIAAVFFLVVPSFYSPWYTVWPTMLAAIMADRRTTYLNTLLCAGALGTYLIQFVLRPIAMPTIGWGMINTLAYLMAAGPVVIALLVGRRQARVMSPALAREELGPA